MTKPHLCSECNELHVPAGIRKEHLNRIQCEMLKKAGRYVIDTGVNNFKKSDVPGMDENSAYGNFQKLRYHGLAVQVRQDGQKLRDRWLITRRGWQFLRGELKLPKFVLVKDNRPLPEGRSDKLVSLLDVLKDSDYLETVFDYFDEQTGAIVVRPTAVHTSAFEQPTLFDAAYVPVRTIF